MLGALTYTLDDNGAGASRLVLEGQMLVSSVGPFEGEIDELAHEISEIDITNVDEIDTDWELADSGSVTLADAD